MSRKATEMLSRRIESPQTLPPQRITFGGELVVRGSTRPLDAAALRSSEKAS